DANRDDLVGDSVEVGRVLRPVDGAAEKNKTSHPGACVIGEHRDTTAMAVREEIEPSDIVLLHPRAEVIAGQRPRRVAVAAGPFEPVRGAVEVAIYVVMQIVPEVAARRLPPRRCARPRPMYD